MDDILKYVELGGPDGTDAEGRLEVMESMLRWRCSAPTAPDTLCKHPLPHPCLLGIQHKLQDLITAQGVIPSRTKTVS